MKNLSDKEKKSIINKQNLAYRKKVKKANKSIVKSFIKEIKTFSKKIYWKSFFYAFYYYKTVFFFLSNKKIIENKISILIPTRERHLKFERFLKSILKTTLKKYRCEILILIDLDDPEKNRYLDIIKNYNDCQMDIKIYHDVLNTHAKRNNLLAQKSSGDILFPANDDMLFVTENWDQLLDIEFSKNKKDYPLCVWVNSGNKYPYLFCHYPIVNRIWYQKLGYIGCELFNFWYLDTWICDLAKRSNSFIYSKKIKFKEYNAQAYQGEFDNTYLRNISDNKMEKDIEIWEKSKQLRIKEAIKLKQIK
tara:strand:+ start:650 stop:1567 length:918 start_codon:yes stop_codon:yes gene_type:complete